MAASSSHAYLTATVSGTVLVSKMTFERPAVARLQSRAERFAELMAVRGTACEFCGVPATTAYHHDRSSSEPAAYRVCCRECRRRQLAKSTASARKATVDAMIVARGGVCEMCPAPAVRVFHHEPTSTSTGAYQVVCQGCYRRSDQQRRTFRRVAGDGHDGTVGDPQDVVGAAVVDAAEACVASAGADVEAVDGVALAQARDELAGDAAGGLDGEATRGDVGDLGEGRVVLGVVVDAGGHGGVDHGGALSVGAGGSCFCGRQSAAAERVCSVPVSPTVGRTADTVGEGDRAGLDPLALPSPTGVLESTRGGGTHRCCGCVSGGGDVGSAAASTQDVSGGLAPSL